MTLRLPIGLFLTVLRLKLHVHAIRSTRPAYRSVA
jgi:hypothetical protein